MNIILFKNNIVWICNFSNILPWMGLKEGDGNSNSRNEIYQMTIGNDRK